MLNFLLVVIDMFATSNGYSNNHWYFIIAFPIALVCYLILNVLMAVKFLKINKLFKTSIILALIDLLYLVPPFLKFKNPTLQNTFSYNANIFKADFSRWIPDITLEQNVNCIIFLTLITLSIMFCMVGGIKHFKRKYKNND